MSKFRRPHGTYSRSTPDWFDTRRVSGGPFQPASPGNYSFVALYNNATDGSTLHVTGLTAYLAITGGSVAVYLNQGTVGTLSTFPTVPLSPAQLMGPGVFYIGVEPTTGPTVNIWALGGEMHYTAWPYNYAMCIMSPGYSLVCVGNIQNALVGAVYQWLVMGPNEGFY